MSIRDWPTSERPREQLFSRGAASLSDAELLAICLGSGTAGKSALDLSRELIGQFGGVGGLLNMPVPALLKVKGLGCAKAAQLGATLELARRALREELRSGPVLSSPGTVREYLRISLASRPHEVFLVVYLDAQHRVIHDEELFRGTLTQTSVYPREIVKGALRANAAAVIFAHNHPSGVAEPSSADRVLTVQLCQALALVDIAVLDHFIVGGTQAMSFAERGLL